MIAAIMRRLNGERGQVLIMFVGIFTVIALAGAIAVDFGLWFSERRGAQTDADLSSLAGAYEYELCLAVGCSGGDGNASAAANDWFDLNNDSGNATPVNIIAPDGPYCVSVDARHDTKALFSTVFGVGPPDVGAHAKACAGEITGMTGLVPIEMGLNNDPCFDPVTHKPVYTSLCLIESGSTNCGSSSGSGAGPVSRAPGGTPGRPPTRTPPPANTPTRTSTPTRTPTPGAATPTRTPTPTATPPPVGCNPHGIIDLQTTGNNCSDSNGNGNIPDLIENGNPGRCRINSGNICNPGNQGPWYDCIAVQPGNTNQVLSGFRARLSLQGPCDIDGDGVESFAEAVTLISGPVLTGLYEPVECVGGGISARIITIIVLDTNPAAGNTGYPIRAFAALYLLGCWDTQHDGPPPTDPALFDQNCSNQGHRDVYGEFIKLTVTNADVGHGTPSPGGTLFGIALVE